MVSKVIIVFCATVAVALAVPPQWGAGGQANPWVPQWGAGGPANPWVPQWGGAGQVNPWMPPWISAPWFPQRNQCATVGATCSDCKTKMICTMFGGFQRACTDPTLPYCNLGECSATPSDDCAVPVVPATTA